MKLSSPLYRLKRRARHIANDRGLPLHQALDQIAREEGYNGWSHLSASAGQRTRAAQLLNRFGAGQLGVLAARPRQGKTVLALEMLAEAVLRGRPACFFTLEYSVDDTRQCLVNGNYAQVEIPVDTSDHINADRVVAVMSELGKEAVGVIDYLQLLDQRRQNPALSDQVRVLKRFVERSGATVIATSQIDRRFQNSGRQQPDLSDIRQPNPVDLSAFDKFCFLHKGQVSFHQAGAG